MKKTIICLLAVALSMLASAQTEVATPEQIAAFYKTKTLVVLENKLIYYTYNKNLKQAMTDRWKITGFEFVDYETFEKKRQDPQYSFLMLTEIHFSKDKVKATYNFLSLFLGGKAVSIKDMPNLCSVPLSYSEVDKESFSYKIGTMIEFIQNHVKQTETLLKADAKLNPQKMLKHYQKNTADMSNKTLYLTLEDLCSETNSLEKIKAVYSGKVEIVNREEVEKAINERNADIVFLHKVGPEGTIKKARCWKLLLGAGDARLYYFDFHSITDKKPDGFLLSDFKKLTSK